VKINALKAENFKGLKIVELSLDSDKPIVLVSGDNGAGKSSLIDSIWAVLDNSAVKADGLVQPIRKGEKSAEVTIDLGELKATRRWTEKGSTLKVENKDGMKFNSPQAVIDKLLGKISFDPLEFVRLPGAKQRETLLKSSGLSEKMEEIRVQKKTAYDNRTEANRELKKIEAILKPKDEGETEEINVGQKLKELNAAQAVANSNNEKRKFIENLRNKNQQLSDEIKKLEDTLEALRCEKEILIGQGKTLKAEIEGLQDPNLEEIEKEFSNVSAENKIRAQRLENIKNYEKFEAAKGKVAFLEVQIEEADKKEKELVQNSPLPIKGLSFSEAGVLLDGVPIEQLSQAEKIKVSCAMAMALNPDLRILRIADGSLLGSKSLKIVADLAKEKDYQVWIEIVDDSGKVGIFIEDGEVKSVSEGEK